jgi:hypothetical protein
VDVDYSVVVGGLVGGWFGLGVMWWCWGWGEWDVQIDHHGSHGVGAEGSESRVVDRPVPTSVAQA